MSYKSRLERENTYTTLFVPGNIIATKIEFKSAGNTFILEQLHTFNQPTREAELVPTSFECYSYKPSWNHTMTESVYKAITKSGWRSYA